MSARKRRSPLSRLAGSGTAAGGETLSWEQGFKGIAQPGQWVTALESTWLLKVYRLVMERAMAGPSGRGLKSGAQPADTFSSAERAPSRSSEPI